MENEINSLHKNDVWDLMELPKGRKLLAVNGCSRENMMSSQQVINFFYESKLINAWVY